MKNRGSAVLALGFAALLGLIAVFGYAVIARAHEIQLEMIATHKTFLQTDDYLREVASEMDRAGLLVRDYLLDTSPEAAAVDRGQLMEIQSPLEERLGTLEQNLGTEATPAMKRLRAEVQAYWDSLDPIFEWSPQEKALRAPSFLQERVLPRWHTVVELANEIVKVSSAHAEEEQQRLQASEERLQRFLWKTLLVVLALGVLIAFVSIRRFLKLERLGESQRARIESAEAELRQLSRSLVLTQELERKALSRELHDAVGQTLTGLRMELGNIEIESSSIDGKFRDHLESAKQLSSETLRLVRDLAMGLRPSMLDDIGLGAALQWQGRQFSRQMGIPVSVHVDGVLEDLSERYRTSIFRVVQEALTNCARHAKARRIEVSAHGTPNSVDVTIKDDGIGFRPDALLGSGIGLVGIRERVSELNGEVWVDSQPGNGTVLRIRVPVERGVCA